MAQQLSRVPKFGNWDNNNIPYTTFFENARKEKAGVKMNPNDPEENPAVFELGSARGGIKVNDDYRKVPYVNSEHHLSEAGKHRRTPSDKRMTSSEEKSNYEFLRRQSASSRTRVDGTRSQNNNSFSSNGTPRHARQSIGSQPPNNPHRRTASIPKFGAWDETDPRSGESFSIIFNRVKEEKQSASSRFPAVSQQETLAYPDTPKKQGNASCASKICCCFLSRERD